MLRARGGRRSRSNTRTARSSGPIEERARQDSNLRPLAPEGTAPLRKKPSLSREQHADRRTKPGSRLRAIDGDSWALGHQIGAGAQAAHHVDRDASCGIPHRARREPRARVARRYARRDLSTHPVHGARAQRSRSPPEPARGEGRVRFLEAFGERPANGCWVQRTARRASVGFQHGRASGR